MLQSHLKNLNRFFAICDLKMNVNKCQVTYIFTPPISLSNINLSWSNQITYLGVNIRALLSFPSCSITFISSSILNFEPFSTKIQSNIIFLCKSKNSNYSIHPKFLLIEIFLTFYVILFNELKILNCNSKNIKKLMPF